MYVLNCDGSSLSPFRAQLFVRYDRVGREVMDDEVGGGRWRLRGRREIYVQDFGGETRMYFKEFRWEAVDLAI